MLERYVALVRLARFSSRKPHFSNSNVRKNLSVKPAPSPMVLAIYQQKSKLAIQVPLSLTSFHSAGLCSAKDRVWVFSSKWLYKVSKVEV